MRQKHEIYDAIREDFERIQPFRRDQALKAVYASLFENGVRDKNEGTKNKILKQVSRAFDVPMRNILYERKFLKPSICRQVVTSLCFIFTKNTTTDIVNFVNLKDHSSLFYGLKRCYDGIESSEKNYLPMLEVFEDLTTSGDKKFDYENLIPSWYAPKNKKDLLLKLLDNGPTTRTERRTKWKKVFYKSKDLTNPIRLEANHA